MTLDIAGLRALCAAATPGPWTHDPEGNMGAGSVYTSHEDLFGGNIAEPAGDLYPRGGYDPKADMVLIAASRAALPAALDEIERLQAEVAKARAALARVRDVHQQYRTAWVDWDTCAGCNQGMELVRWPCPTIQALDAEGADRA